MSNSIIDSIQATETGEAFWEHFNQSPTAVDQLIRDLVEVDADYTIPLPAQHAMTGEVLHRDNSQAADIVCCVLRDQAKWDEQNVGDRFE